MAIKDTIIKNFKEFFELAELAYKTKKYNGAVTLYYKALVELCDLSLLQKTNRIGATHTERFSLLQRFYPKLYCIASKLFRFYRDSYSKEISPVIAKLVKKNVEEARRLVGFEEKD